MALKYSGVKKRDNNPKFDTVDKYLQWLLSSKNKLIKGDINKAKDGYKMVQTLVGSLLVFGYEKCYFFAENIDTMDDWSKKATMQNMILVKKDNKYTLRLFLKSRGPFGALEMEYGDGSEISSGCVSVRLSQSLPSTDRQILREEMQDCVTKDNYVSPKKISSWLQPVLEDFIRNLNGKQAHGYTLSALSSCDQDSYTVIVTCVATSGKKKGRSMNVMVSIEVALAVSGWPKGIHFQHPYPRRHPYIKQGQQMLHKMRQDVDNHKIKIAVHCKVGKPANPSKSKNNNLPDSPPAPNLSRRRSKARPQPANNKPTWKIELAILERIMLDECMSTLGDEYQHCTSALDIYGVISVKGKRLLPKLDENIKNTLLLWLIKKDTGANASGSGGSCKTEREWFIVLLEKLVHVMESGFCPCFSQPNVNVWTSGKVKGMKLAAIQAFVESLKDQEGVQMVKHAVGIYGLRKIIKKDVIFEDILVKKEDSEKAKKKEEKTDKNEKDVKDKGKTYIDPFDDDMLLSMIKQNKGHKTPSKLLKQEKKNTKRSDDEEIIVYGYEKQDKSKWENNKSEDHCMDDSVNDVPGEIVEKDNEELEHIEGCADDAENAESDGASDKEGSEEDYEEEEEEYDKVLTNENYLMVQHNGNDSGDGIIDQKKCNKDDGEKSVDDTSEFWNQDNGGDREPEDGDCDQDVTLEIDNETTKVVSDEEVFRRAEERKIKTV